LKYVLTNYRRLGERVYQGRLDNGLTCIFIPKPGFKRKFAVLATPYGAIHRNVTVDGRDFNTPSGIAHFLEHKLFESPEVSIENRFASLGASVNAYTTHTMTAYLFSTAQSFYQCLDLLLDFVQNPSFTPQGVETERSVIAQEILMYNDQPSWAVYLAALRGMYGNHPVAEDIAGSIEDLEKIDYGLLKECHGLFYHPGRMVLVISGDLPVKEVYNYVAANQRRKSFPAPAVIEYAVPPSGKGIKEPAHSAGMEVSRPMLCLGLKDRPTGTWKEAAHREMVAGLLLEIFVGKNSPFYNRLYDDGIIDSTFGVEYSCTPWYSHFIFGGECDTPQLLAEQLLEELNRLRKCGVNRQLLEVNLHKLLGLFIMDLNGLESTVMACAADWLQDTDYLARFEAMRKLTREDVEEFLHSLDLDQTCLSVVNPLE